VYYRVYAPDGAIPARTAPDPGNPFIGLIKATSVPPPHNLLSLKRALGQVEKLPDPDGTRSSIYRLPAATVPLGPTETIKILGPGVGETPATALAFVLNEELSETERTASPSIDATARSYTSEYGE
jgi:hypothetical protein